MESAKFDDIEQYRSLHEQDNEFGTSSKSKFLEVRYILSKIDLGSGNGPVDIIDFGCGKGALVDLLIRCGGLPDCYRFHKYDPAIEQISVLPVKKADFLINTDMLEHIYENDLDIILSDMANISTKCYFNISTRKAKAVLPNGENAHVTIKPAEWWMMLIKNHWKDAWLMKNKKGEATIITFKPSTSIRWLYATLSLRRNFLRIRDKLYKVVDDLKINVKTGRKRF